jgi:hypothetical protein
MQDIPNMSKVKSLDKQKFLSFKIFLEYSAMLTKYSYLSNIALDFDVSVQRAI